ncbi:MAG: thioredoxin family protein [Rhodomicrobium sp.]
MFVIRSKASSAFALALIAFSAFAALSSAASAAQLVVFGSAHCPYCLAWEREIGRVYPQTGEARQAPLRRLDVDAGPPADLRMKEVHITPTFVLVDNGREVGRIVGYSGGQSFWPELHRLLAKLHPRIGRGAVLPAAAPFSAQLP